MELTQRLRELPANCDVVAYCRGPYCALFHDVVVLLQQQGFTALRLQEGYPEWKAEGLPVQVERPHESRFFQSVLNVKEC